jgi:predicted TIM-barrel fold metal-dependent hydrolase
MVLGHREIADIITSLICHGTLTRFPRLRIASVENGSSWIFPLFNDFEDLYKKMPQNFPEHPHDVFRRNIWVSPFWEGCVSDVVTTVGWDKVLFGSDYPHPEGRSPNRRTSGSTPRAWTSGEPTTSWVTMPAGSSAYRSPIPIHRRSIRQR